MREAGGKRSGEPRGVMHKKSFIATFIISAALSVFVWPCAVNCRYQGEDSSEEIWSGGKGAGNGSDVGLSPPVFNLARHANIAANGTCGEGGDETYCKLVEHVHNRPPRPSQCQVCSADSHDKSKRHPIKYAIDESNRWWQSPTLQNGRQYEWITITINLKKVYQVAYIIIKAANSPRPGNWILERSKDGVDFLPWQYFAVSDDECWTRYGIVAKAGKPVYSEDDEVICTSYFSKITPFEGGEIHTSLVNGRPGSESMSEKLTKFTMAQYIRLRLQKIRTLHADLMTVGGSESRSWDKSVMRRYFYSIKDIAIGGSCVCFGHASECVTSDDRNSPTARCMCQHNTCGDNCDVCCPLFNQYQWGPGNSTDSAACEECECHGQADSCLYDPDVHEKQLSMNTFGTFHGGGVCLDCKAHTAGVNCEKCQEGYYRPKGVLMNDPAPCVKCNCSSLGSMGYCVPSEKEAAALGKNPGDCICKDGFSGRNCDECGRGYRGYPDCEPCPCNLAGIVDLGCEGDCVCKENVEGSLCNACKKGFFNLNQRNVDGCTQCFCHGVATQCISSNFAVLSMSGFDKWFITDLHGTKIISALQIGSIHHVANEEFGAFGQYYWTAGEAFSGKLIHSYGLNISFHVSWVQARGDTSGRPIQEYDVIVQSTNSMLAFGYMFHEGSNATVEVTLNEMDCFVLPDVDNNVIQRVVSAAQQRTPCTRYDVMEGLSDIKRLLIRAKFHTDQIEGMLHSATFEKADPGRQKVPGEKVASSVEICSCPQGYVGTSCENCAYAYRKSSKDSWLNECIKCDCNGHSPSCDFQGNCLTCEHNTTGANCQDCLDGFYGDPSSESLNSCKPCECPLSLPSNNFSPTCKISGTSYQCTACPEGYAGPFCERCSNGYYGSPTQPGDFCKPCNCNADLPGSGKASTANICDHLTGECLVCPKFSVGWNCDECLTGYFGDALNGTCSPCMCNEEGSLNSNCDLQTGQCYCKQFFQGPKCDVCGEGHGSPKEGCPSCDCNALGSKSQVCDGRTGQCVCKDGIGGRYCNKCLDVHFGFGFNGCTPCDCHPHGSDSSLCDLHTGQCHCLPHVEGRKCETCSVGFWNVSSGDGCDPCDCTPGGSLHQSCDPDTGQCACKPGVGGLRCDGCLEKHYGMSLSGCKECDPCEKEGHNCDPQDGHCVCPPNTEGERCEKCLVGFWGHSSQGCKECNCSQEGSTTPQCSTETGKCHCVKGFEGTKCNLCKFGFYSYPACAACDCDPAGTTALYCDDSGLCSCSESGNCHCKENVGGKKCDRCKDGSYGLDRDSPEGCMECFCFQRSNRCSQGYFKWQRLALPTERNVEIMPGRAENRLRVVNNLIVIPDTSERIFIENDISFGAPLYWQLPHIFLGDKVLSYNGYLRFHVGSSGHGPPFPPIVLSSYPIVQIQGNHKLILEYFSQTLNFNEFLEVRLHEDLWRLKHGPFDGVVTKEVMMVALQNLQHILVRATHAPEVLNVTLFNVSLDIAIPNNEVDTSMAHGIEVCECPPEYNSTSCQNPKLGFYRWYKREYITSTVIIDLVGQARPCDCNGRANFCDTESGHCVNCTGNTAGPHCDLCASGYYGDAFEKCLPCPCPSVWSNHADACFQQPSSDNQFQCFCKAGYVGKSCERCDYGFFGKPWEVKSGCEPCHCNPYGSVSDECHEITGQCNCRPGVTGRDCSRCSGRHIIIAGMCTSCNDSCTGKLLKDVDDIAWDLQRSRVTPQALAHWKQIFSLDLASSALVSKVGSLSALTAFLENIPTFTQLANLLSLRIQELRTRSLDGLTTSTFHIAQKSTETLKKMEASQIVLNEAALSLHDYLHGKVHALDPTEAKAKATAIVNSLKAPDLSPRENEAAAEMESAKEIYDAVINSIYTSTLSRGVLRKLNALTDKLQDVIYRVSLAGKDTLQAKEVTSSGRQLFLTAQQNLELVDNITVDMDVDTLMTADKLSEGGHGLTEVLQVLLMIEDILRDLRNTTKEVEIRGNSFFDLVPLYRTEFAQPAFDHVAGLRKQVKHWQGVINSVKVSGSESLNALTAYQRIRQGFENALTISSNASIFAAASKLKILDLFSSYAVEDMLDASGELVQQGLTLSGIVENAMRNSLATVKSAMSNVKWKIRIANETLRSIFNQMEQFDENLRLDELLDRVMEISTIAEETKMEVVALEEKIERDLTGRVSAIKSGASVSARDITANVNRIHAQISQANEMEARIKSKLRVVSVKHDDAEDRLRKLNALITQSRHKSDTVRVSIGPDETGTCYRLFKWPTISEATSIRFNFAPTKSSDSLLFYWPSSLNEDYISIEMVDLRIKASWELGSGLRTLIHPKKITRITANSDDPDYWVTISLERLGASVSLDVKPAEDFKNLSSAIVYQNDEEEATLMDLSPDDLIHIGGMSKQVRSGLVSNGLSGCIHNLVVNSRAVGLWNFVGNEGCGPCTECLDNTENVPTADLEYHLNGRGYALVNRIESNSYNPKFFDLTMEFKTYSETALLFLTVNETIGQMISLELKEGNVLMQIRNGWDNQEGWLKIESVNEKCNSGEWVKLRAIWVNQKGVQTGQLTVGANNYKEEKKALGHILELYDASYQIGGLSPAFNPNKWQEKVTVVPFVGCLKNLFIDSSTYDLMSGLHFGVEPSCSGKTIHITSFEGDGYGEFPSREMGKDFMFGFSFKTLSPTGLLVLSTFVKSASSSPAEHYCAVYLENGKIRVQVGVPQGPTDLNWNETRYDDGKFHAFRFVKKNRRVMVYMDDAQVVEGRLPKKFPPVLAAPSEDGLFIGGLSHAMRQHFSETQLKITRGFAGCIQNFYFGKTLLNFNYPVTYKSQNLGQCPSHFTFDSTAIPQHFMYPATVDLPGMHYDRPYADHACMSSRKVIEQEDPVKALHFGDSPESYATISLDGSKMLRQNFNLSFHFRTFYPNGLFLKGVKRKTSGGHCLAAFIKEGHVVVRLQGDGLQELASPVTNLHDGGWHRVAIVKAEEKLYLYIDSFNATVSQAPKLKTISKLHIGGSPSSGLDCFENLVQKPDYFKGCMKSIIINSHSFNLDTHSTVLHNASPCFRDVQRGTFFKPGGYAIYSHNFTLGNLIELELEFRSDARNGILLSFIPNTATKFPTFAIYLQDGNVVANESYGSAGSNQAVQLFPSDTGHICNGEWHSVKANYENGAITLRVDSLQPIYAVIEPVTRANGNGHGHGNFVSGSLYIGGLGDGASRSTKKRQFHGCIRNIAINRQRKDWTDMAQLTNVFLNACPA